MEIFNPPYPPPQVAVGVRGASSPTPAPAPAGNSTANVTVLDMHTNRFWLFVRDNGPAALYDGYLSVINTVVGPGSARQGVLSLRVRARLAVARSGKAHCTSRPAPAWPLVAALEHICFIPCRS